jgi:hypothetical protein
MGGKRQIIIGLLIGALAFTAGCGDSDQPVTAAPSPVVNSPTDAPTPTPEESPTVEPTTEESPSDGPTEPVETPTPGVLASEAAGKPLTLSSVFKYPPEWKEGRYDIADRKQASGISGIIPDCGDSYGQTLELRLANNFSKLKLEFGQSNSSESSDQTLQVRIDTNGQYVDQKTAKLNQITKMEISVAKVNAMKIILSLKQTDGCNSGSVEAVLTDVVLS